VSAVPGNKFELCFNKKDTFASQLNGGFPIIITNRTKVINKVYIIYEQPSEIIYLQTLLEEDISTNILNSILQQVEAEPDTPIHVASIAKDKELYCCRRR